jgi:hypothetical protein
MRDLRLALRQLRKAPGFSLTIVLTLALGIGATTAIFSLVEGILLRPLPLRDPQHLILLGDRLGDGLQLGVTAAEVATYEHAALAFSSMGAYITTSWELSGGPLSDSVNGARLTAGVFPTLGVAPIVGRVFTQQEDDAHAPVAVISYALWLNRFHRDPHVAGATITLDRRNYTIVGVMPRSFEFPLLPGRVGQAQLWVPMSFTADELSPSAGSWGTHLVARLKDGVTVQQATQDADRIAQQVMRDFPRKLRFAPFIETYGDYFRALGIPLIAGRLFTVRDRSDAPIVCVVDQSMAKQEWPGQSAIGKRLHIGNPKRTLPWATVVGVVSDVRIDAPDQPAGEQWYFPLEQPAIIEGSGVTGMVNLSTGWIALRSTLPPEQMIHTLRSVVAGIDPRLALDPVQPMADAISAVEGPRRFNTGLITAFALAALLLAAMGIYTVIAFSVSQRTQEIAIRMALGAQRGNIARLVLGSGAKIAAAGCALGLFGSLAVSRFVRAFLFGVSATNPIVYTASICLMLALALLASTLPALSAAAADPAHALRSE